MRANCGKPKNKSVKLMEVIVEKKKNFHTTRQLITRNAVSRCGITRYSGDSFQDTRHPLATRNLVTC